MSRILLACLVLLGLGLASCSSAPADEVQGVNRTINPDISTKSFHPHPRGLMSTGQGFNKYFLGHDPDSPFAHEEAERGFLSLFTGRGESFGSNTAHTRRPGPALYNPSSTWGMFNKWVLNNDPSDPYAD